MIPHLSTKTTQQTKKWHQNLFFFLFQFVTHRKIRTTKKMIRWKNFYGRIRASCEINKNPSLNLDMLLIWLQAHTKQFSHSIHTHIFIFVLESFNRHRQSHDKKIIQLRFEFFGCLLFFFVWCVLSSLIGCNKIK